MLRLDDSTRGASGPTAEPQEGGASNDDTLLRTGRSDILYLCYRSTIRFSEC